MYKFEIKSDHCERYFGIGNSVSVERFKSMPVQSEIVLPPAIKLNEHTLSTRKMKTFGSRSFIGVAGMFFKKAGSLQRVEQIYE